MATDILLNDDEIILTDQPGKTARSGVTLRLRGPKAKIYLGARAGSTSITPGELKVTKTLTTNNLEANQINLAPKALGEGRPGGKIKMVNKSGEAGITLNADTGDIVLKDIGSLLRYIKKLERRIVRLERR